MANITVSQRRTHPATYVQLAGVTMAGMGPLIYAVSVGLISVPGWASYRYFLDQVWAYGLPIMLNAALLTVCLVAMVFFAKRIIQ